VLCKGSGSVAVPKDGKLLRQTFKRTQMARYAARQRESRAFPVTMFSAGTNRGNCCYKLVASAEYTQSVFEEAGAVRSPQSRWTFALLWIAGWARLAPGATGLSLAHGPRLPASWCCSS
jgi:hypothetical protein